MDKRRDEHASHGFWTCPSLSATLFPRYLSLSIFPSLHLCRSINLLHVLSLALYPIHTALPIVIPFGQSLGRLRETQVTTIETDLQLHRHMVVVGLLTLPPEPSIRIGGDWF
jgi:hypothetical protein